MLEPDDWVWVNSHKERFPYQRKAKLMPRGDVTSKVLERLKYNAYKVNLPSKYQIHNIFNVCDLSPFLTFEDEEALNLRRNSF